MTGRYNNYKPGQIWEWNYGSVFLILEADIYKRGNDCEYLLKINWLSNPNNYRTYTLYFFDSEKSLKLICSENNNDDKI